MVSPTAQIADLQGEVPIGGLSASIAHTGYTSLSVSATAPRYAAPCLSLNSQGVDAIYVANNAVVVKRVVDGCAQEGYKPVNVGSTNTADPTWLADPNFTGTLIASTNPIPSDTSNPGIAAFTAALNKYDPGITTSADAASTWSIRGWPVCCSRLPPRRGT